MKSSKVILVFPQIDPNGQFSWFPFSTWVLGSNLKEKGYNVCLIDQRTDPQWRQTLKTNLPDAILVGISAMTGYQIAAGLEISSLVKENAPDTPVAWGGRHATILPEQTLTHPMVDIVVVGQGELTLIELCHALAHGTELETVDGIGFKKNNDLFWTPARPIADITELARLDFSLLTIEDYINPATRAFAYFSSYGCPNRCGFCANSYLGRRWMSIKTDFILDDLEYLISTYKFKNLIFQDSNFFVNRKRILAIAQGFLDRNFSIQWKASARTDQLWKFSHDELALLERSGLCSIFIGVESGSEKMLKLMTKDSTAEHAERTVSCVNPFSFQVHASLIFTLPGETVEDLKKTIHHVKQLKRLNPRIKFQQCFYSPFPGTPLYDNALKLGWQPPASLEKWANIKEQTSFSIPPWFDEQISRRYAQLYQSFFNATAKTDFHEKKKIET